MTRRGGLGKGLGALIPSEAGGDPTGVGVAELDIADIVPSQYQPRDHFDEESLAALAASIAEVGVIQPIIVRRSEDGHEIVAGERRWRAAQRAGLRSIPALVRLTDDKGALEAAVIENVHRQDLNALEEGGAYRQLMDDFGLTQDQIATRVGRSRSAIANTIRLLNLEPQVQRLIVEGLLSAGHGRALLTLADAAARQDLAEEIVRDGLTVRETEDRVSKAASLEASEPSPEHDSAQESVTEDVKAGVLELEELLSSRLETSVSVQMRKNRGRITIRFGDLTDLERIYHLIMMHH